MPGLDMGIGMGANLVGGIMQSIAAQQAQQEMFKQFQQELARQYGYRGEATGVFQPSLQQRGIETARQQMAAGQKQRMGDYANVGATPLSPVSLPYGLGTTDQAKLALEAQGRAKLGSYNDWQLDQLINNIRTNEDLRKISSFAAGSEQVFPYRMYQAQHSGDELAFWGNLISSLGGSAQNYASAFGGSGPPSGFFSPQAGDFGYQIGYQNPNTTLLWNTSNFNPFQE